MTNHTSFKIGKYLVKPVEHSLLDGDGEIEYLQPKFIEVLSYLADSYPDLVSRDTLIDKVWEGNRYVGEKALTNAIWHIRKSLHKGDDEYIQTVRKSGYRLLYQPQYMQQEQPRVTSNLGSFSITNSKVQLYSAMALLLVLCSLIVSYLASLNQPLAPAKITSLTSSPGREVYPAVSPDGQYLVYYWKQTNKDPDLYIKDLRQPGIQPEQITFDTDRESKPVWGKNGKAIYFAKKSWQKDRCHIVKLDLSTKKQTQLARCKPMVNSALAISNNGKLLAFNGFDDVNTEAGIYLLDLQNQSAVAKRLSCQGNCNFSDRDATFSPDDKQLVFTRRRQPYEEDLFLYHLDSKQWHRLTTGQTNVHGMAWHPSGKKIVYSAEIANQRNGYVVDLATKQVTSLAVPGFSFPTFIGNTSKLVYHDWRMTSYIATLSLAEEVQSVPFPLIQSEFNHKDVDFSESQGKIAYVSNESGANELWSAYADGTERERLTSLNNNVSAPRWSHKGDKIAFLVRQTASDRNSIYILDTVTRQVSKLNSKLNSFGAPNWTLDDKFLLVEASDGQKEQLFKIKLSGEAQVLIDKAVTFAVQTSANVIWYSVDEVGLFKRVINGDNIDTTLMINAEDLASSYSWLVSKVGVYFLKSFANHQEIQLFEFTTNTARSLIKTPLRTLNWTSPLTINKQKKQLIFSQRQSTNVDIKMLEHTLLQE